MRSIHLILAGFVIFMTYSAAGNPTIPTIRLFSDGNPVEDYSDWTQKIMNREVKPPFHLEFNGGKKFQVTEFTGYQDEIMNFRVAGLEGKVLQISRNKNTSTVLGIQVLGADALMKFESDTGTRLPYAHLDRRLTRPGEFSISEEVKFKYTLDDWIRAKAGKPTTQIPSEAMNRMTDDARKFFRAFAMFESLGDFHALQVVYDEKKGWIAREYGMKPVRTTAISGDRTFFRSIRELRDTFTQDVMEARYERAVEALLDERGADRSAIYAADALLERPDLFSSKKSEILARLRSITLSADATPLLNIRLRLLDALNLVQSDRMTMVEYLNLAEILTREGGVTLARPVALALLHPEIRKSDPSGVTRQLKRLLVTHIDSSELRPTLERIVHELNDDPKVNKLLVESGGEWIRFRKAVSHGADIGANELTVVRREPISPDLAREIRAVRKSCAQQVTRQWLYWTAGAGAAAGGGAAIWRTLKNDE